MDNPFFLLERNTCFLTEFLSSVYESEEISFDVDLLCYDHSTGCCQKLRAHRTVLAAASPFFNYILAESPDKESCITLEGYSIDEIRRLLEFLYKGSTISDRNSESSFKQLLEELEIGGSQLVQISNAEPETNSLTDEEDDPISMEVDESEEQKKTSAKTFKCTICGQVLNTRTGLRLHLQNHNGPKQFTCEICGKGFSQGSQLKTHQRVHTKEKPYKCDICDKSFSHASTLSEHRNLHTAEKPFECNVCHKVFAQRKALRVHRCEDESADRPKAFQCPFCSRSFTTRRGLGIHKMHQHVEMTNEPLLQCDKPGCGQTFTSELAYEEHLICHFET